MKAALALALLLWPAAARAQILISTGGASGLRLYYPNSNDWWLDPSGGRLDVKANGGSVLGTLSSNGSAGLGTSNPAAGAGSHGFRNLNLVGSASGAALSFGLLNGVGLIESVNGGSALLRYDSANGHQFQINEATKVVIDAAGNVGIGTTNPQVSLHVNYVTATALRITGADGNSQQLQLGGATQPTQAILYSYYNGGSPFLALYNNGSERLRIDSTGNVGIGTTGPNARLNVVNTTGNGVSIFGGTGSSDQAFVANNGANSINGMAVWGNGTIDMGYGIAPNGGKLVINGNVGIGTTSPDRALDVNSRIKLSHGSTYSSEVFGVGGGGTSRSCTTRCSEVNSTSICLGAWNHTGSEASIACGTAGGDLHCLCAGPVDGD